MAHIEQRALASGAVWRVRWRQDGQQQVETFTSPREAERFRIDVREAGERWPAGWVRGVGYSDAPAAKAEATAKRSELPSLLEHCLAYAESKHTRAAVEGRLRMRRKFTRHLGDLGAVRLDLVTREAVQAWLDELAADGYAWKTINNVRSDVSSAYKAAPMMTGGAVVTNPVKGTTIDADRDDARPPVFLTREEFDAIAAGIVAEHQAYVHLLVRSGLRKGEAAALRVGDVDLTGELPALRVTRALKHGADGVHRIGRTKTRAGRRTVVIDAELAELLRQRIGGRPASALLFDNLGNDGTWQRNHWAPAVNAAQLAERPRMHDLRHTHASWLLAGGMPLFAVSKRLGHADIQTTANVYGHLDRSTDAASAAVIGAMMAPKAPALRVVN